MFLKESMLGASATAITARNADTGQAWNPWLVGGGATPVWTTGSGTCRPSSSGTLTAVLSAYTPPSADESIRFKVKIGSFMGSLAVVCRESGSDLSTANFYQIAGDATGGTTIVWGAAKVVAGTNTALGSTFTGSGYTAGQTLDCTATVSGSSPVTITLAVGGTTIGTWTDPSSPFTIPGVVGFYLFANTTPSDSVGLQFALFESPPEATGFTISGVPGSVNVGSAIAGTVTPNAPVGLPETVTVADDLANTLGTLNFVLGDTAGRAFSSTATSGQVGSRTVTATPSPTLGTPPTASTTITNVPATAYTLTDASPASGFVANASASFTLRANGIPTTALVVTPSDGAGGAFTPSTLTITDAAAHTFTYTPSAVGSKTVSVTHTGGSGVSGDPASVGYTSVARTLAASPAALPPSSTTTVNFASTGGTHWLTTPPAIAASAGVTAGSFTAVTDTTGHAAVTTPATLGAFTYTDSTDGSTASGTVAAILAYSSSFDFGSGYVGALASAGYTLISRATQAAIGSRVTSGVSVSSADGTVSSASIVADPTVPFDVRWDSGGGSPVYGVDPYPTPPYAPAPPPPANWSSQVISTAGVADANLVRVNGSAILIDDGTAVAVTATSLTQQVGAPKTGTDTTGQLLVATRAATNSGACALIAGNTGGVLNFAAWFGGVPTLPITYRIVPPTPAVLAPVTAGTVGDKAGYALAVTPPTAAQNAAAVLAGMATATVQSVSGPVGSVAAPVTVGTVNDKAGYALSSAGLDAVQVEVGVNMRQAMSPILASIAGVLSGAGTGTVAIKGARTATTRIMATTDASGNRPSMTLILPS